MPPSQRSSCKSSGEASAGRLGGLDAQCTDIDIDVGAGRAEAARSYSASARSDHGRRARGQPESSLQIEVGDRRFFVPQFPLLRKSNRLKRLAEPRDGEKQRRVAIPDIPGGAAAFELIARHVCGGRLELSPRNVAAVRCAAEYLEMADEGRRSDVVSRVEEYLAHVLVESWRDSITVLKSCSELAPWGDELEIVRRCSEAIAWKFCKSEAKSVRDAHWWFEDVCSLSIDMFGRVVHAAAAQGVNCSQVVGHYAEKWLQLTRGSDMSTTLKIISTKESTESPRASFVAFTGFNQDIVAKDAKQTQHKNRAILQGIVSLLPPQARNSLSVKFMLKLLQVACLVNAGSLCKTDLAKRVASQLERASLNDLLIPAFGDSTFDVLVVQQIVEFYIQGQSFDHSPPASPRSAVSGLTSSTSSESFSGSSFSASTRSDSSSQSDSDTESTFTGSSISGSSVGGSGSSRFSSSGGSFTSASSRTTDSSSRSSGSRASSETSATTSTASSRSCGSASSSGFTSNASVKPETKTPRPAAYVSESPNGKTLLAPTAANFKVAQLLESYLEEIAKDSSITFGQFFKLAELLTEFPRDSDDSIYRAIDAFLKVHPSLPETERKNLCRLMDTGALSLAASVHAACNERLPVRVIVQLLFSEQVKLRNEMTANEVIHEKKDLGDEPPSFSTSSSSESSSDGSSRTGSSSSSSSFSSGSSSSSTSGSGSGSSRSSRTLSSRSQRSRRRKMRSRSVSISSASALDLDLELNLAVPTLARTPSVASAVSSQLPGGLSVKGTLRFVLAEIGSLRKSVQEIEAVKRRLGVMETLQVEMEALSRKFQEMSHDYLGMTQQVEELARLSSSKNTKSGWSSGWKKVTKSFQTKDGYDLRSDPSVPPLPPLKLPPHPGTDTPAVPVLATSKSDTLHPKTPRADAMASSTALTTSKSDSFPAPRISAKADPSSISLQHPRTPVAEPPLPPPKTTPRTEPAGPSARTPPKKEAFPSALPTSKVEHLTPIAKPAPKTEALLPGAKTTPAMEPSPGPKTAPKAESQALNPRPAAWRDHTKSASASSLGSTPSIGSPKKEMIEPARAPRRETVGKSEASSPATSKRQPEREGSAPAPATGFKGRGRDHFEEAHRKPIRSRSASPESVQRSGRASRAHSKPDSHPVSASASATGTSTSASTSSHATPSVGSGRSSERQYRRRRRSGGHGRDGYPGRRGAEKSASGRRPRQRQKDGSNERKEHVSIDSHPVRLSSATQGHSHHNSERPSSATQGHSHHNSERLSSATQGHSHHNSERLSSATQAHSHHNSERHRHMEGSVGSRHTRDGSEHRSGSHRSARRNSEVHGHRRHHQHHRHLTDSSSDSDASRDLASRRRHR